MGEKTKQEAVVQTEASTDSGDRADTKERDTADKHLDNGIETEIRKFCDKNIFNANKIVTTNPKC